MRYRKRGIERKRGVERVGIEGNGEREMESDGERDEV